MSTHTPPLSRAEADRREMAWASGFAVFAGVVMGIAGLGQALLGFAGVFRDGAYAPVPDHVPGMDPRSWGWLHLVVGIALVLTGISVIRGRAWARAVGIWLVMLTLVVSFAFVPYHPVWAIMLIALDVAVIWGLARHGGDQR